MVLLMLFMFQLMVDSVSSDEKKMKKETFHGCCLKVVYTLAYIHSVVMKIMPTPEHIENFENGIHRH